MSTIQKSASLPTDRFPLFIFNIFAGFDVKDLIIVSNFTEPLWYNSKLRDNNVSIPDAQLQLVQRLIFSVLHLQVYDLKL